MSYRLSREKTYAYHSKRIDIVPNRISYFSWLIDVVIDGILVKQVEHTEHEFLEGLKYRIEELKAEAYLNLDAAV